MTEKLLTSLYSMQSSYYKNVNILSTQHIPLPIAGKFAMFTMSTMGMTYGVTVLEM